MSPARSLYRKIGPQNLGLLLALIGLSTAIRVRSDKIFLVSNLLDIGVAVSILGILAVAQMAVIISGGLDISIGSIASLAGVSVAMLLRDGLATAPAIAIALLVGVAAGLLNGLIVTVIGINPIIVTLATYSAYGGLALVMTNGLDIAVNDEFFNVLATDQVLGIPYPVWLLGGFALIAHLYLRYTVLGRHVYALGSNEDAARNTGLRISAYKIGIYLYAGFAGALAGLLGVAQNALGQASSGSATQGLTAITAALLGGAALTGGRGSIPGAILGVILLGLLDNGLVLIGANPFYSQIFVGVLLVAAVAMQTSNLRARVAHRRRQRETRS